MYTGEGERSILTSLYNSAQIGIENLSNTLRTNSDTIIETVLNVSIEGICNNNLKNRVFMERLMRINYFEKETTLSQIGNNALSNGDSSSITRFGNISPSYTKDYNYIDNFVKYKNEYKTSEQQTSSQYTSYQKIGELYSVRTNLVPDELNKLSGTYSSHRWQCKNKESLLWKTKKLFNDGKINTIISKFGTGCDGTNNGVTDSSDVQTQYGMSHGKNLLIKDAENGKNIGKYEINGYNNPYCRVWTHHYQYDKLSKLIRPFVIDSKNNREYGELIGKSIFHKWKQFTETNSNNSKSTWKNGDGWKYSVLNDNGFLNITPKYNSEKENIHTKQCMFSIENLAWKGYDPYSFEKALSWEQRGPMGGRIMWFPPYGITYNETTQANWSNNTFIGRGEDVYTYTNTVRTGNLNFMMVVDHPSIIDYVSWQEGIEDNVSDTDLLRFFSGCDYQTITDAAKPTPFTDEYTEPKYSSLYTKPQIVSETKKSADEILNEVSELTFYAFYPNNYSGCYDHVGNDVEAIAYLLDGVNAQKSSSDYTKDVPLKFENIGESKNGIGYEMSSLGISYTDDNTTGPIYGTTMSWTQAKKKKLSTYPLNKKRKWNYRIDGNYNIPKSATDMYKNTYDQVLLKSENYSDKIGYSLNSDADAVKEKLNINDENLYSLSEVAAALTTSDKVRKFLAGTNNKRVEKLIEIFNNDDIKIKKIKGIGFSNSHGNNKYGEVNKYRNETLAKERVYTVSDWIKNVRDGKYSELVIEATTNNNLTFTSSVKVNNNDINNIMSKIYRSAKITLEFEKSQYKKVAETSQSNVNENGETVQYGTQRYVGYNTKYLNGQEYYEYTKDGTKWIDAGDDGLVMAKISEDGSKLVPIVTTESTAKERARAMSDKYGNTVFVGESNRIRYDQEYHFFKELKQTNPIIYSKLMDKIRYFDPAFHSMTPEGFNARLTFLQQCTRQGNTIGASDTNSETGKTTASNLAFGRPPFCVLRLGDFYNQMIVIDNISINYDSTFDLNIEGIGVQPLLANVSISFKFIGGGDMTGPIRRLQNAMSFNYYANTRLYDNRADKITYKNTTSKESALSGNIEYGTVDNAEYYVTDMNNNKIEKKPVKS